jgi:lipopolysaccharide export system permease protein
VFLSILHRMILWELTKVFFLSLLAITGILLMAGIVAEASQQGLGPTQVLAIIPLLIPSTLPYTLPATTLFATCIVYGRLAGDNEVLAIKAAGVNVLKVVWPGVVLGLVISCATMGLYYRIIPYTHLLMRTMFLNDIEGVLYRQLKKDKGINFRGLPFAIFVRDVQGRRLIDATIQHRRQEEGAPAGGKRHEQGGGLAHDLVIRAREAELEVDLPRRKLIVKMHDGEVRDRNGVAAVFKFRPEEIDLPPALLESAHIASPRDMSWRQLGEKRALLLGQVDDYARQLEEAQQRLDSPGAPPDLRDHIKNLSQGRDTVLNGIRQIDAEFQMRPALSFGCLCFVLIGCPVGIWFSKSDYLSAFITCFLPIVFVYYPLMLCGTNYAKEGRFPPLASVWAANVLVAVVGLFLYGRLLKN